MKLFAAAAVLALMALGPFMAHGSDWPCWRGPDLNGISTEQGWQAQWPGGGAQKPLEGAARLWCFSFSVGGGAETALEGVRWHWVLLVLGERRAGLYDGQQQRDGLGVLPGRQHRKEGLGTFVSLRAGPQELRGRAVRDADRAGRAGLYVQPKGGLVLPRCGEGDGGLVEAAEPGARPGDTDVGMRQLGPGRRGVGGGEYGERRGGAGPEVGQSGVGLGEEHGGLRHAGAVEDRLGAVPSDSHPAIAGGREGGEWPTGVELSLADFLRCECGGPDRGWGQDIHRFGLQPRRDGSEGVGADAGEGLGEQEPAQPLQ